jgi:predicted phosphodiesterase
MKGFLFIGDPHVTSKRPGRRKDDFLASVLGKLQVAAEIARREDLMPVILGDLFHRAGENHWPTISRLTAVLQQFHVVPLCLGGNHDKDERQLTEVDALQYLDQVGVLRVVDGACREALILDTPAGRMALWAAPYGAQLPESITSDADQVVLITHHDLAFEGCYPGSSELYEIPGCDLVVNGHMHKTAPSVQKGQTNWHCPGNIEPLSIDCRDHVPSVWSWMGGNAKQGLTQFVLPHEKDCFDLTGTSVAPAATRDALDALSASVVDVPAIAGPSHFAELLSAQSTLEASRTEDDETFLEDLELALGEIEASDPVSQLLLALAKRAPAPNLEG